MNEVLIFGFEIERPTVNNRPQRVKHCKIVINTPLNIMPHTEKGLGNDDDRDAVIFCCILGGRNPVIAWSESYPRKIIRLSTFSN